MGTHNTTPSITPPQSAAIQTSSLRFPSFLEADQYRGDAHETDDSGNRVPGKLSHAPFLPLSIHHRDARIGRDSLFSALDHAGENVDHHRTYLRFALINAGDGKRAWPVSRHNSHTRYSRSLSSSGRLHDRGKQSLHAVIGDDGFRLLPRKPFGRTFAIEFRRDQRSEPGLRHRAFDLQSRPERFARASEHPRRSHLARPPNRRKAARASS